MEEWPIYSDAILKRTVGELLEKGRRYILFDLQKTPYMDSCGLGQLVACNRRVLEASGTLKLLNPSKGISELLELMKLEELFETFHDREEALASFARLSPGVEH